MPSRPRERAGAGEIFDRAPRWMIARAVGAVVVPVSIAMALSVWLVTLLRDDASREVVSGSVVSAVYTETVRRWFRANERKGGTTRTRANEGVDDSPTAGVLARETERARDDDDDDDEDDDEDARGRGLTERFSRFDA